MVATKNEHREATEGEIEIILACKKFVLDKIKCRTIKNVVISDKWFVFAKKLNEKIIEKTNSNIKYMYKCYLIKQKQEGIKVLPPYYERSSTKKELNKIYVKNLKRSKDRRYFKKNSKREHDKLVNHFIKNLTL